MGYVLLGVCITGVIWLSFMGWATHKTPGITLTKGGQYPNDVLADKGDKYVKNLSNSFYIAAGVY